MFPSDPTFNELHIREKQMLLGAILIWLNDMAQYSESTQEQNDIVNKIIDLVEVDRVLNYFIDYERSTLRFLNEARLTNAKLKLENQEMQQTIDKLQKALDNAAENI
mgnify:FL=1|jgi:hypothetical protein